MSSTGGDGVDESTRQQPSRAPRLRAVRRAGPPGHGGRDDGAAYDDHGPVLPTRREAAHEEDMMTMRVVIRQYTVAAMLGAACLAIGLGSSGCGLVHEGEAYIRGMESWVYGYPLVMMDVTRDVLTAAPAPNDEGTAAPINQLAKMPHYVEPRLQERRADQPELAVDHGLGRPRAGADRALGPGHQGPVLRLLDDEHVDGRVRLRGQAHDWDGTGGLPHRRAEVARHGAGGHQADLPFADAVRVAARTDAGERPG